MSAPSSFTPHPIVIANWKMYLGLTESVRAARAIRALSGRRARQADIVLCPSFPALPLVREVLAGSRLHLGAQDAHADERGPHTGDVSAWSLRGLARYVIIGHSERRQSHGETDEVVAKKLRRALRLGLHPILCVGETAEERDAGNTVARIHTQLEGALQGVPALSLSRCVIAYEPVWAISAGLGQSSPQPDPADVAHVMGLVRRVVADRFSRRHAERVRVVYGGSVNARTVAPFVSEPGVDGVLVGAASTSPGEFDRIIRTVITCRS